MTSSCPAWCAYSTGCVAIAPISPPAGLQPQCMASRVPCSPLPFTRHQPVQANDRNSGMFVLQTRNRLCAEMEALSTKQVWRPERKHGNIPL